MKTRRSLFIIQAFFELNRQTRLYRSGFFLFYFDTIHFATMNPTTVEESKLTRDPSLFDYKGPGSLTEGVDFFYNSVFGKYVAGRPR
jgi:hypothetical protein